MLRQASENHRKITVVKSRKKTIQVTLSLMESTRKSSGSVKTSPDSGNCLEENTQMSEQRSFNADISCSRKKCNTFLDEKMAKLGNSMHIIMNNNNTK